MATKKKAGFGAALATLLDSIQTRVSDAVKRGAENSDQIAALDTKIDAVTTNSARSFVEQNKALVDNASGTTYALNALKASTQRAFDGVSNDIKSASDCAQRHNARISKLEGSANQTALDFVGIRVQQMAFGDRLTRLEAKAAPVAAPTTSALETDLKNLLKSYGYDVSIVSVSKQEYDTVQTWGAPTVKNQQIKIEVGGSKKL